VKQIADVFRLAVKEDKNYYMLDLKAAICQFCLDKLCIARTRPFANRYVTSKQRLLRWCNAPDYVRVAVVDENQREKAHMRVDLRFECPRPLGSYACRVDLGKFDCVALIATVEQESRDNKTKHRLLKTGTKGKDFNMVAACSSKEVTGSCPNAECLYQSGTCF
jgi:hypothetical protein